MGRELVGILYVNTSHPYHKPVDIRGGRGHLAPLWAPQRPSGIMCLRRTTTRTWEACEPATAKIRRGGANLRPTPWTGSLSTPGHNEGVSLEPLAASLSGLGGWGLGRRRGPLLGQGVYAQEGAPVGQTDSVPRAASPPPSSVKWKSLCVHANTPTSL